MIAEKTGQECPDAVFPYIDLGFFKLPMYGLMLLAGFAAGLWLARRRAVRYGLPPEVMIDLATVLIVAGLAGGRLLFVFLHWDYFLQHPEKIIFNRSDFVFFGGAVTGVAAGYLFCRWKRLPFADVGDAVAPAAALGHAFGRLGCFSLGCCYGKVCQLPWGVCFPPNDSEGPFANPVYWNQVHDGLISQTAQCSLPVHPTQLYESVGNVCICLILLGLTRFQRFRGQILLSYLLGYAALRFCIEFYRGDPRGAWGAFSTSQWVGLVVFLVAAVAYGIGWRRAPASDQGGT